MSSSQFQDILTNASGVKEKLLGPDYTYYDKIKDPASLGMSSKGTLNALGSDIEGLQQYVALLVSGKSKASVTGQPLGNKFFLQTMAKCDNGEDRYAYLNFVPNGNIPIISNGLGVDFSDFKGLIPGTISNLNSFNPMTIMQAFLAGSSPTCQEITMEVIDNNNLKTNETHYVSTVDIQNMDACWFSNKTNPITGVKCRETFRGYASPPPPPPRRRPKLKQIERLEILSAIIGMVLLGYYCSRASRA